MAKKNLLTTATEAAILSALQFKIQEIVLSKIGPEQQMILEQAVMDALETIGLTAPTKMEPLVKEEDIMEGTTLTSEISNDTDIDMEDILKNLK